MTERATMLNRLAQTIGTAYADHRINERRRADKHLGCESFVERYSFDGRCPVWITVAGPFPMRADAAAELNRIVARAALAELREASSTMLDEMKWRDGGCLGAWQAAIDEAGK